MRTRQILSKQSTTEVRERIRALIADKPELVSKWFVDAEIVEDHLMKATVSLPELKVKFTIFADEPAGIGGHESAMPPFGYFLAGALMCEMAQYTWNAAELGLTEHLSKLRLRMEGGFPLQPLYGLDDRPGAAAIKELSVVTEIEGDVPAEQIAELARLAAQRCPAHQSLTNGIPYRNSVELNGQQVTSF